MKQVFKTQVSFEVSTLIQVYTRKRLYSTSNMTSHNISLDHDSHDNQFENNSTNQQSFVFGKHKAHTTEAQEFQAFMIFVGIFGFFLILWLMVKICPWKENNVRQSTVDSFWNKRKKMISKINIFINLCWAQTKKDQFQQSIILSKRQGIFSCTNIVSNCIAADDHCWSIYHLS